MNTNPTPIPVAVAGPGSQPVAGEEVAPIAMPSGMQTYVMPELPEPEEVADRLAARATLAELSALLRDYRVEDAPRVVDISHLHEADRDLMDQVLAVGEVSVLCDGSPRLRAQESVLAGVWRVEYLDAGERVVRDTVEIAAIPGQVRSHTFAAAAPAVPLDPEEVPAGVLNAPPLVVELNDHVRAYGPGVAPHVINLTLLPQTPEDLAFLEASLGTGPVTILSRGYGNCRITSTATAHLWRVKYFNSRDALILDTIEVVDVPAVALASQEDVEDSARRLDEILAVYR